MLGNIGRCSFEKGADIFYSKDFQTLECAPACRGERGRQINATEKVKVKFCGSLEEIRMS